MVFLDGIGIGAADAATNPFFASTYPTLSKILGGKIPHLKRKRVHSPDADIVPLNATLGVSGLPQSGTGQTALFTGVNAAKAVGRHYGPFPYSTLRPILAEKSIFHRLLARGRKVHYANAYPQRFFDHLSVHPTRVTAMVQAWRNAGFVLNGNEELTRGHALSADITSERWVAFGFGDVPVITPRKAGERLVEMLERHDFVLYEYFQTDHAGHHQSMTQAVEILHILDEFLGGIEGSLDREKMLFLLTSDHGNLEDLSRKTHTRNMVPLLLMGAGKEVLASRCTNLTHVTPAITEHLT